MNKCILLAVSTSMALIAGCKKYDYQIVRTSDTPYEMAQSLEIPIYENQCEEEQVYGESPQCGMSLGQREICEIVNGARVCRTEFQYPKCNYTVKTCNSVFAGNYRLKAQINFDRRAPLGKGQSETLDFTVSPDDYILNVKVQLKSPYYAYDYPRSFQIDLRRNKSVQLDFKRIR